MFHNPLTQPREDLLRLAFRPQGRPEPPQRELHVPDDCVAVLLRDGQPVLWFQPGRHPLPPAMGLAEARLIPLDLLPQEVPVDRARALELPFERALYFADGLLMATLREGQSREARSPRRPGVLAPGLPKERFRALALEGEEDLSQSCSFV